MTAVREITNTFSEETKYYKSVSSLEKHCPVGRYAHHTVHGAAKVVGHVDNGRRGAKVEIAVRTTNGIENYLVDSDEIKMVTRIPRHLRQDVEAYFEVEEETKEEVVDETTSKDEKLIALKEAKDKAFEAYQKAKAEYEAFAKTI